MLTLSRWKILLCVAATLFGAIFTFPNLLSQQQRDALPGWVPKQTLNLGLDLQGGSYLLLEVDTAALRNERIVNLIEDVRVTLRKERIQPTGLGRAGDTVQMRINDPAQLSKAITALRELARPTAQGAADLSVREGGDQRIIIELSEDGQKVAAANAVDQSIEIIRRRIDETGTKEPTIVRQGANRIVVQAPGESDPERLKRLIGQTAKLTFQMVETDVTAEQLASGRASADSEVLQNEDPNEPLIAVKRRALVTGEMLKTAGTSFDQSGLPVVTFEFNSQGARRFGDATRDNVNKRFAIILDRKVISAPVINEPILGGSGQISGNFTAQSAGELATLLRAGALPAPLVVQEQRTVGAELGADAIKAGQISTALGAALILIFIVLAYGLFGWFAAIALVINGLLIVAFMSVFQATLTLPGIAGLILTLAVAVDANVLIYERMRDEARAGRSPISAADAGYSRAMSTIIDANVTSLVASAIMFAFGAGPVRGFAWTLSIGIFTSVFTSVLVTQVLIAYWIRIKRPKKLPIV